MNDVELTVSVGRPEPGPVRLVATLVVTSVLAGLILSSVYQITKPVIEAYKRQQLREGVFTVVPGSSRLRRFVLRGGDLVPATEDEVVAEPTVHAAFDDTGAFLGWAIAGDGPGFQDTIEVLFGYDPGAEQVTGMHILASRETPGLGDKIFKDEDFIANFDGLALEPTITVVKDGRDAAHEVDAITGATISSRAVANIINEAHGRWRDSLRDLTPSATDGEP
ncbi:MAG: FMN-binding protein [Planctomycetota bacterium]|jgi:electron transport complex protein RnfG